MSEEEIELKLRIKISQAIKRQRDNYEANNLFGVEYQAGMSDAALIAYDPDKHDEQNLESTMRAEGKL